MNREDRPFIFKDTHECGNRRNNFCGDCWNAGRSRRRFTSKARRRYSRKLCRDAKDS